jgi:hypothetical protein
MTIVPTLSELRTFDGSDLANGAEWLDASADRLEETHAAVHDEARNLAWEGDTREATVARTGAALQAAQNHADKLRSAAQSAREEAGNLTSLSGNLVHAADKAGEDGYNVSDMYVVTDKQPPSTDPTVAAARQMVAGQHESAIMSALAKFVVHDTKVGTDLATRGAQLQPDVVTTPGLHPGGGNQMVDNHFKTGGGDDPFNDPPMKPVGDEPIMGGVGGSGSLEQQAERDMGPNLPAMPGDWPKQTPVPSPPKPPACKPEEYARDVADNVAATAGTTVGLAMIPISVFDPLFLPWAIAESTGVEKVVDTSEAVIDCAERGFGG